MSLLDEYKPEFEKIVDHLIDELSVIRTGRASPALVENIQVEAYGTFQPVKAVASMSTPDAKTLEITPWDTSVLKAIETAIIKSDIGINPVVDGKMVRLNMPMMTEETRKKMVKVMNEKLEDSRVHIRKVREEAKKKVSAMEGGQDVVRKELEALEKMVKGYVEKIDAVGEKKEKEVMSI
ncbi:MAG: ribosome recycling factor [Patescibacteria group bacterium]|jgi:ribosome recycling factor